jgi:hypothetical protein
MQATAVCSTSEIIGECCIDVDSPQERFKLTNRSRAGVYNAWFERDRGQVRSSLQNLEAWAGVIVLGAPTLFTATNGVYGVNTRQLDVLTDKAPRGWSTQQS